MTRAANSSSLPAANGPLIRVPLGTIVPHPSNPNEMSEESLLKLEGNVRRQGGAYPPLIVRPHPTKPGLFQLIDGHQRLEVVRRLGHEAALCYVWACDDQTALQLLATLNRLHGEDVPIRRAELLAELAALMPEAELAELLPDGEQVADTLALLDLDTDELLADLERAATTSREGAPRLISFAVLPADEPEIEAAIEAAMAPLQGRNKRGRALALIARRHLAEAPSA